MATIMVVDGNEDVSFIISEVLKSYLNARVIAVGDGAECLDLVERELPDVVILNGLMSGMDGFEVCKRIKKNEKTGGIPVILMVSGAGDNKSKMRALELGADDYLVQPIDNLELVMRVNAMLKLKRLTQGKAIVAESRLTPKIAHQLRSPLNSIIGMAELLQKPFYGELNEKQREFAQIIAGSGNRLLEMINKLAEE